MAPMQPPRMARHIGLSVANLSSPQGVTQISTTGHFAVVDNSQDKVFIYNPNGVLRGLFSTAPFSLNPQGIAFDSYNQVFAILETTGQEVMLLSLPGLVFSGATCDGDFDGDGDVDGPDLATFSYSFGRDDCR